MYEGHMPNGSGIQKHSAGELFPVIIVHYGDGQARWVDPEKRLASDKCKDAKLIYAAARAYKDSQAWALNCATLRGFLRRYYEEFVNESAR